MLQNKQRMRRCLYKNSLYLFLDNPIIGSLSLKVVTTFTPSADDILYIFQGNFLSSNKQQCYKFHLTCQTRRLTVSKNRHNQITTQLCITNIFSYLFIYHEDRTRGTQ